MSPPSTTPALGQPPEPGWTADIDRLAPPREARGWLTELGLLTERVRSRCHGTFGLRIVDERLDLLSPADAAALEAFIAQLQELKHSLDEPAVIERVVAAAADWRWPTSVTRAHTCCATGSSPRSPRTTRTSRCWWTRAGSAPKRPVATRSAHC